MKRSTSFLAVVVALGLFLASAQAADPASIDVTAKLVEMYKTEFPAKLNAVRTMPPADMLKVVDFFGMFQWPAVSYLGFGNNHSVHHRGQLATYLRAMGSKVPAIYGGSADEPMQG